MYNQNFRDKILTILVFLLTLTGKLKTKNSLPKMKYLYLIIRHIFPRHKWRVYHETEIINGKNEMIGYLFILKDQFGNLKEIKSCPQKD